ncbi:histone family protein DNA-binding protein [Magnetococcus marinus MC-1]|uniref:Histone family protein DNA-binding protein n=1 Tax=Magnetococcus marinus (strain ATCC BAA-1437 / JCM 17883 / MC-1) TaxID=156889 RepID=A0LBQ8_MAGMM|nr:HU family DNA-binding protein [Magnetococcus marinus]ABK45401.1 histone family protein DNA-binding protein [Magnetococcus marinus MC-1]
MTKSELILTIAAQKGLTKQAAAMVVDMVFNEIGKAMAKGERVELRGFGVFEPRARKPRAARNPKTGEKVAVESKTAVHFKPGLDMRKRVDY